MPDHPHTDSDSNVVIQESTTPISQETTTKSQPFIGQWNQLISTTNWEKGEIIHQWRTTLMENGVAATEHSDEAWSQMVGGVTPQHVGRLRRAFERFGHVYREYEGVYWSHFYASLDWDDAEMWLEGAVQNKWSVSRMRKQRWETLGKVGEAPVSSEIVATESVEETQSLALAENTRQNDRDYIEGPVHEGPDWGDEEATKSPTNRSESESGAEVDSPTKPHAIRPFESFDDLPEDVMEVANAFKVAIIRHKADQWSEISQEDMVGLLDALKQLATIAPQ